MQIKVIVIKQCIHTDQFSFPSSVIDSAAFVFVMQNLSVTVQLVAIQEKNTRIRLQCSAALVFGTVGSGSLYEFV